MAEEDARGAISLAKKQGEAIGWVQGEARGLVRGLAESILGVLDARELVLSEALREQVLSTRDEALLKRWLQNAALASSAEEALRP